MFGACRLVGELYVTCGMNTDQQGTLSSVDKYTPLSDTWSSMAPLPFARYYHAAVAVGSAMYVLQGRPCEKRGTNISERSQV
jgi:hypothetical protein